MLCNKLKELADIGIIIKDDYNQISIKTKNFSNKKRDIYDNNLEKIDNDIKYFTTLYIFYNMPYYLKELTMMNSFNNRMNKYNLKLINKALNRTLKELFKDEEYKFEKLDCIEFEFDSWKTRYKLILKEKGEQISTELKEQTHYITFNNNIQRLILNSHIKDIKEFNSTDCLGKIIEYYKIQKIFNKVKEINKSTPLSIYNYMLSITYEIDLSIRKDFHQTEDLNNLNKKHLLKEMEKIIDDIINIFKEEGNGSKVSS